MVGNVCNGLKNWVSLAPTSPPPPSSSYSADLVFGRFDVSCHFGVLIRSPQVSINLNPRDIKVLKKTVYPPKRPKYQSARDFEPDPQLRESSRHQE